MYQRMLFYFSMTILFVMLILFWYPAPPIRNQFLWLIYPAVFISMLRSMSIGFVAFRHPIMIVCGFFVLVTLISYPNAPFARESYLVIAARPLFGIMLVWFVLDILHAKPSDRFLYFVVAVILLGVLIGFLALTTTQWDGKSAALNGLINRLPRLNMSEWLPNAGISFNANEIAGALTWLTPTLLVLSIYPKLTMAWRRTSLLGFGLLYLALFLGQSRFATAGVLVALLVVAFTIAKISWMRRSILFLVLIHGLFQGVLLLNLFPTSASDEDAAGLSNRDQTTFRVRFDIWDSAWRMMLDYPATGVGMGMFRTAVREPEYLVPHYADRDWGPPHAHQEWFQIAADLGILGLLSMVALHVITALAMFQRWRHQPYETQLLIIAIATGFIAHIIYGLGDAIPLWDRFAFLFWLYIALGCGITLQQKPVQEQPM